MVKSKFPELNKDAYYFGIYFPDKRSNMTGQMGIWIFSSIVLLIVIIFFSYTLLVIFKQKRLSESLNISLSLLPKTQSAIFKK